MRLKVAQFFNLVLFCLVVGVFWGTWFSLSRSIGAITPATLLEIGRTMIENLAVPMAVLMPGTILWAVLTLLLVPNKKSASFFCILTGAVLMLLLG